MSLPDRDEKQLGELYEVVLAEKTAIIEEDKKKKPILAKGKTKEDMVAYLHKMIELKQPRLIRDEGRPSKNIEDYAIPTNFYRVSSNMVNFNLNEGFFDTSGGTVEGGEATVFGKDISVFKGYDSNDLGTYIGLYLFQHGRKTVDELLRELPSYDPDLLQLILNRMQDQDFVKWHTEEDGTETLEILTKKEREERFQKRQIKTSKDTEPTPS